MRRVLASMLLMLACTACAAPEWHYEFDSAIQQARQQDKSIVVFYKDPLDPASSRVLEYLRSPAVWPLLEKKVRCTLVPFYAPNRKFAAQYGVFECPALIVVHPDGTYHALRSPQSPEAISNFLSTAKAPGDRPATNLSIPSRIGFEYFNIYRRAVEKARRQNRPLLIVYKWWVDPDSSELIRRISRPSVAEYYSKAVICILDWDHAPNRFYVSRYGISGYPALIWVQPDGSVRTLKGLPSVEQIIRFANQPGVAGGTP